jgi:hypothetical protein
MTIWYEPRESAAAMVGTLPKATYIGYGFDFDEWEVLAVVWKPGAAEPILLKDREVRYIMDQFLDGNRLDWNKMHESNDPTGFVVNEP